MNQETNKEHESLNRWNEVRESEDFQRLLSEWEIHGKVIIAVDFDDTISPWKRNTDSHKKEFEKTISLLKDCKNVGAYITVFTACDESRYDYIKKYCSEKGLVIDAINENVMDLPYGKGRKIYYNILLDDRAGLAQSKEVLEAAMIFMRSKRSSGSSTEF